MKRRGLTLLELIVTLAVLGIAAGVTAVALVAALPGTEASPATSSLAAARSEAIAAGRPVTITDSTGGLQRSATAFPDGRVVADPGIGDADR